MQIIPTILDNNFKSASDKIKLIKDLTNWIQIDVIDGMFADGKTFEMELLTKLDFSTEKNLWEMHLMVNRPEKWLEKCLFSGASRVIGQVETMNDPEFFVGTAKDMGMEAGLAFKIDTEIDNIPEDTDVVLLMARELGFGSYKLNEFIYPKIEMLKHVREKNGFKFRIGIDGGVNLDNIYDLSAKGIDIAYCGSFIFNGNVKSNIENLTYASQNK